MWSTKIIQLNQREPSYLSQILRRTRCDWFCLKNTKMMRPRVDDGSGGMPWGWLTDRTAARMLMSRVCPPPPRDRASVAHSSAPVLMSRVCSNCLVLMLMLASPHDGPVCLSSEHCPPACLCYCYSTEPLCYYFCPDNWWNITYFMFFYDPTLSNWLRIRVPKMKLFILLLKMWNLLTGLPWNTHRNVEKQKYTVLLLCLLYT